MPHLRFLHLRFAPWDPEFPVEEFHLAGHDLQYIDSRPLAGALACMPSLEVRMQPGHLVALSSRLLACLQPWLTLIVSSTV